MAGPPAEQDSWSRGLTGAGLGRRQGDGLPEPEERLQAAENARQGGHDQGVGMAAEIQAHFSCACTVPCRRAIWSPRGGALFLMLHILTDCYFMRKKKY